MQRTLLSCTPSITTFALYFTAVSSLGKSSSACDNNTVKHPRQRELDDDPTLHSFRSVDYPTLGYGSDLYIKKPTVDDLSVLYSRWRQVGMGAPRCGDIWAHAVYIIWQILFSPHFARHREMTSGPGYGVTAMRTGHTTSSSFRPYRNLHPRARLCWCRLRALQSPRRTTIS